MSKQAQRLAEEFAETIRKDLTETELLTVNERNDKRNYEELSCATHDFIDSNESMLTAMKRLNIKVDLDSDKQIELINEAWQIAQESNFALSKWNPGDQANPAVMCEMCQAIDTPIGGNYIMTVSEEECKWIDRKNHKENQVSVVSKLNEIASLANELCEAWEAEGNRDASTIPAPWPFSTDKSGGLSIDEWASEVSGLAEAYEPDTSTSFRNNPYRREWRDYWKDYTDDLAIPEDWVDNTWHNNELPSFIVNGYHIWINSPRAEERKENYTSNGWNPDDYEDWRFAVNLTNADGEIIYTQCQSEDGSDLFITLDFDELVAFVSKPRS
jgi:hypothetical protein